MNKIHSVEPLCTYHSKLSSPIEVQDSVYMVAENGDILKYADGIVSNQFIIIGQPSSIAFNTLDEEFLVSDFAHQSIVFRHNNNSGQGHNLANEISSFKGESFLGPHSVIYCEQEIYFTDSGPFCESSLQQPIGSVFAYYRHDKKVLPLAYKCLAYPTGLTHCPETKELFVCEMAANRILRFIVDFEQYTSSYSTFYQFSGRFGPSAISAKNDFLYVARYEFKGLDKSGMISVLNMEGELIENIQQVPGPEITGLYFSASINNKMMYLTDNTDKPTLYKITFKGEKSDDREEIIKTP